MRLNTIPDTESIRLLRKNLEIFRANILKLLQKKKMTQNDLARQMKRTKQQVSYFLADPLPNPSMELLGIIANALEVEVWELLRTDYTP